LRSGSLQRILVIARYEVKRAVVKKKVLAGLLLIVASQGLGLYGFSEILRIHGSSASPIRPDPSLAWVFTYFLPSYLLSGLASLIASGSFSEEFERGYSETLYTKPATRLEIFFGKLLGGYMLQAFLAASLLALSLSSSTIAFGPQSNLDLAYRVLLTNIYSNTVFFSISMALSAITRNTLISTASPIALLLFLPFVTGLLIFLERSTGTSYSVIARLLPSWGASLHIYIIPQEILQRAFLFMPLTLTLYGDPVGASISVAGYSIVFLTLAASSVIIGDIPKR